MSVAAEPRSHAPYAEPDEYIDYQLRKTQTGIKRIDMLTAAIVAITVLIGYVLLFVLSDHWLFEGGVGGTARVLMFLPVIGFVGWLIGAKVIWPALRTVSGLYAARTLEASSTEFRSGLLNLVDLKQAGREVSPLILATMEKRAAVTLTKFNVDDAIDKRPLLRTLYVLTGIVVAFCGYVIFSPKPLGPSVLRAIIPFTNVAPGTQTEIIEVKPGDAKLRSGGILPVSVQLRSQGELPTDVTLLFTTDDRRFVDEPVQLGATTDPNVFEGTLGNDEHGLLQSFSYHVIAGDARSPEYRVEIVTPPSATVSEVRYDYPEYTELDPRTQVGGAIDVWERTIITITAATNVPVKRAEFELADTEDFSAAYPGSSVKIADGKKLTIAWRADPRQADGKFPKFYRLKVWDAEETPDPKPAVYPINVRIDQPPQVVLIDPTTNLELPANGTVPLVVAARDQDFKLRTVSLKIARDENDVTDETLFDGSQQEVALKHDFLLEPLRLKEGDKIRIWVEAQDNRLPTHNLTKTPPIEITIKGKVTKEEAKKQLEEQKQEQQQRLDEANKKNDQANDPQPSDPANSPDQPPRDPNEREQPKDKDDEANKEQPQQKGQQQDDKTSKSQNGGSSKTQKGGEGKKTETGGEGKSDKPGEKGNAADGQPSKSKLKDDGTQDQEALEKIAQDAKRRGQLPKKSEPQTSSPSTQREPKENSTGESADKPMPNSSSKPNSQDGPKANDSSKPPQANRGQQSMTDKNDDSDPKPSNDPNNPMPGDKPDTPEKGTDPKNGNDPKNANGAKEPKGQTPNAGDEPKPGDNKNSDGGKKPMPNKEPGAKSDPAKAEDKTGGDKPGDEKPSNKPDAQKPSTNDKPGNDPQQPSPNGGEKKTDGQKPKGLGKPETDDKQRSPDGAKSDKPSNDNKSTNPKGNDPDKNKPDGKQPNDPSGKGSDDKDANGPDKQPGSEKSEGGKPDDKGSEKSDPSKKPRRGQQGNKPNESADDKGTDNKAPSNKPGSDQQGQPKANDKNGSGQPKQGGSPKADKGGQKPGGKEGQPKSSDQPGEGSGSDSGDDSKGPAKPGQGGGKPGKAGSSTGGSGSGQSNADDRGSANNSSGSGPNSEASEEANEEFTKEAANLVLKKIKNDLDRGEVDQELLDELGWTEEQMKKFVDRMEQQLDANSDDDSPQAKARRRQFEEMLKSLNLTEKTQRRDDTNKDKQTGEGIGPVRRPPPADIRQQFESYTKGLAKKKTADTPKK